MSSEQIVRKQQDEVKECLQEMYQSVDSSFTRIHVFLDQLPLASNPPVIHNIVNNIPKTQQIQLPLIQTISNQVIEELVPIFKLIINKQIQQKQDNLVQFEQQNKPFKYQLIQNHSIKQNECCRAIAFNKDNSIVLATCDQQIIVFEFKSELLKQTQILTEHQNQVTTLNFMKKSTQFISASSDKQIIIWSMNSDNQWIALQKLSGHSHRINCLVLNNNEDLIISGSLDKTIKFWVKQNEWKCSQTITDHTNYVYGLSLNEQQNQVISCGNDMFILIIEQSSEDQKWNVIQKISVEQHGRRLCFINDNMFTFQPYCKEFMDVYEMSSSNKQYVKTKHIPVKCGNSQCNPYFPQQYIKSKCLVVIKNGYNLNLIRKNQKSDFITLQSIDFGYNDLQGQMSDDGEYLITWDGKSKEIQIRKYHQD